ncbi:MAG: hypothetical protein JWQ01_2841 [Massilia sp.]|nr:hypothetical protein [Massilia sp.]
MSRHFAYTLAVPQAALDDGGNGATLAIDYVRWQHLASYLDTVDQLPAQFGADQPELGAAIGKLRHEVERFGSPRRARALLLGAAPGRPATIPPDPYAGLVWWIQRLQVAAASVVTILQKEIDAGNAGGDVKQRLESLSNIAATIRTDIQPLTEALASFKAALTGANRDLAAAANASAGVLQQMQEQVGAAHVQITSLENRIASLGILEGHKKPEMMRTLAAMKADLEASRARAEEMRLQHGMIETILGHGAWLEGALGAMAIFLEKSRGAWTNFGSGVAQLAADATAEQLADTAYIDQKLNRADAIVQWSALDMAAQEFAAQAMAAGSDAAPKKGYKK